MSDQSSESYEGYIRRYRTRNFLSNAFVLSFYNLAISFVFPATIMTLYASHLTDSAALIGTIPALFAVGMSLPQLLYANVAERLKLKRPLILKLAVMERIPYLFIGLSILLLPDAPPALSFAILLGGLAVASVGGGMLQPVWKAMLTKLIEPQRRGLLFGLGFGAGGVLGTLGALASRGIIAAVESTSAFGVLFLLSFAAHSVSIVLLAANKEPARETHSGHRRTIDYLRELPVIMGRDRNFRWYIISQITMGLSLMGVSFYVLYARSAFGVSEAFVANLTMAALVGAAIGVPVLGLVSDRWGNKVTGMVSLALLGAAAIVLVAAPGPLWLLLVFASMHLGQNAGSISRIAITMEFSTAEKVPTYTGLSGTLVAPALFVAPIAGGWVIDAFGYHVLFVVILALTAVSAALMGFMVREPRRTEPVF